MVLLNGADGIAQLLHQCKHDQTSDGWQALLSVELRLPSLSPSSSPQKVQFALSSCPEHMAANKEIDDQVRKDIRTLSATLTRETGVSPLATSSDAREHLSDVDAIVALLTTATDDDELGNRVVAVTASHQAGCIETLLVTRNPRGDYDISESVVGDIGAISHTQ
ncbi:hypothetical protein FISHEDRAFT_74820 [Fistulina hepatica ATCC 64428]|uniref:Uncharacterized protein n=1 Tax=Fistulina hepatica ATCC 64428 TaxID=1128425 RepID=A0A0D7A8B7_9AGAR|nr:hypothetical protein FISHEDRAFT_74820 [Fistulina hepatica ATCC 64428]